MPSWSPPVNCLNCPLTLPLQVTVDQNIALNFVFTFAHIWLYFPRAGSVEYALKKPHPERGTHSLTVRATTMVVKSLKAGILLLALAYADEHTHKYELGDEVVLWMNTVGPYHNRQETYTFMSLPFCQGVNVCIY